MIYTNHVVLFICISLLNYSNVSSFDFDDAQQNIQQYLRELKNSNVNSVNKCIITNTESCGLNKMAIDESTLVQPGGNTRCMFSYSTPFAFQVRSFVIFLTV